MVFSLIIFGNPVGETQYNLVSFKTIGEYIFHSHCFNTNILVVNFLGNIGIFRSVQYFLLKIFSLKKFKIAIFVDFLFVFLIAFLQYFT